MGTSSPCKFDKHPKSTASQACAPQICGGKKRPNDRLDYLRFFKEPAGQPVVLRFGPCRAPEGFLALEHWVIERTVAGSEILHAAWRVFEVRHEQLCQYLVPRSMSEDCCLFLLQKTSSNQELRPQHDNGQAKEVDAFFDMARQPFPRRTRAKI